MNVTRLLFTVVISLGLSLPGFSAKAADQDQETDYWESVSIDRSDLNGQINQITCSYHIKVFFGCVEAVKLMASFTGKSYDLYPVEIKTQKAPLLTVGRFKLVESDKEQVNTQKELIELIKRRRSDLKARFFSSSLQFMKNPSNEFETLITEIEKLLPNKLSKAQIGAVLGKMLEVSIDPHTSLRPAKELQSITNDAGASFFGIGVQYSPVESGMLIQEITANSGAEKAGLKSGDIITTVDGKEIKGLGSDQVRKLIVGPENTSVEIVFLREGKKFKVAITRKKIEEKVVSGKIITDGLTKIGYLKISNFMYGNMCPEVKTILTDFENQNVNGLVMDLRGNPGGDVKNAQCLGGFFLGKNKVVSYFEERTADGFKYSALRSDTEQITKKPLVVLINSGSASASEIMSGALQDYARALIVGQTSFGKGSYQGCGPINKSKDLIMCQTGGLFHLPSGRTNQTTGVVPDVSVYIKNKPLESELYPISESNLYLFPLEPKAMPNSHPEKWPKITVPQKCIADLDLDKKFEAAQVGQYFYNDYQLLNAVGGVTCLAH